MDSLGVRLRRLRIPTAQLEKKAEGEIEEPLTPAARLFIHPEFYSVVFCILGFQDPIDLPAVKKELLNTIAKHKRFSSVLRTDRAGRQVWAASSVNIDDHVIVPELEPGPRFVEDYIAKLGDAEPLDVSKPLWDVHVLNHGYEDAAAVGIFRFHHAIGDGISLMSLFLASTRQVGHPELLPTLPGTREPDLQQLSVLKVLWNCLLLLWYSVIEIFKFGLMLLYKSDSDTKLKGRRGAESWPKELEIVSLSLDDMKIVKRAASSTINDVLLAVISIAIKRYLKHYMKVDGQEQADKLLVRALVLRNTRPAPGLQEVAEMMKSRHSRARWGNNMGYMLIPLTMNSYQDPLEHVRKAKACTARKKMSLESHFTYVSGALLVKLFGAKGGVDITYRSTLQTTLTMSNVMGPREAVSFAGNAITSIVTAAPGLPQGLVIHMTSYKGTVKLALMVKKRIIPDSGFLAQCFKEALEELKQASNIA